jgi:hypothetical protein
MDRSERRDGLLGGEHAAVARAVCGREVEARSFSLPGSASWIAYMLQKEVLPPPLGISRE